MRGKIRAIVPIFIPVFLGGCGSNPYMTKHADGSALVFGYIDMKEAPSRLGWVEMKRVKPRTKKPNYHFFIKDGLFYEANIPAGSYKFTKFGGFSGWKNTEYTYSFQQQGRGQLDPIIREPGIYFVGAWKYKKVKTGFFQRGAYDLTPVHSPSEKELLGKLLPYATHDAWKAMIKRRLRKLK